MSEAVSELSNVVALPGMKRGRGRPPGSRNKTSKTAKQLLDLHGKGAIETLCAVAAGHVVYSPPDEDGNRTKLSVTLYERLFAAKIIADKLLPNLKFAEVSAEVDNHVHSTEVPATTRDLAKSVLSLLARGVPDARVTVSDGTEHIARFRDPDLGRKVFPDSQDGTGAFSSPSAVHDSPASENAPVTLQEKHQLRKVGDAFLLSTRAYIRKAGDLPDGRQQFDVFSAAGEMQRRFFDFDAAHEWALKRIQERKL